MPFVDLETDGLIDFTAQSCFDFQISNLKIHLIIKPLDQQIKQLLISLQIQSLSSTPPHSLSEHNHFLSTLPCNQITIQSSKTTLNQSPTIQFSQVFDVWDFFAFTSQNRNMPKDHHSLLWLKLYLHQYFTKIIPNLSSQKSLQTVETDTFSSATGPFHLTNLLFIRKAYLKFNSVNTILQQIKAENLNQLAFQSDVKQQTQLSKPQKNEQVHNIKQSLAKKFIILKINPKQLPQTNNLIDADFILILPRKSIETQRIFCEIDVLTEKRIKSDQQIQNIFFNHKGMP